jgi:DNA-binding transcriptional ArsR family regulator
MGRITDLLKEFPLPVGLKLQIGNFDEEFSALELRAKNLEVEVENLRQEIQRRDDVIQKEKSHNNLLDEPKVKILKLLFSTDVLTVESIAQTISADIQTTKYHLEELKTANMIKSTQQRVPPRSNNFAHVWAITQPGRAYLIEAE